MIDAVWKNDLRGVAIFQLSFGYWVNYGSKNFLQSQSAPLQKPGGDEGMG
jgi:hypothetical protein